MAHRSKRAAWVRLGFGASLIALTTAFATGAAFAQQTGAEQTQPAAEAVGRDDAGEPVRRAPHARHQQAQQRHIGERVDVQLEVAVEVALEEEDRLDPPTSRARPAVDDRPAHDVDHLESAQRLGQRADVAGQREQGAGQRAGPRAHPGRPGERDVATGGERHRGPVTGGPTTPSRRRRRR